MSREPIVLIAGIIVLGGAALTADAGAKENPYHPIVQRNPFGLRPAVTMLPLPQEVPPPPPARKVFLTGMTTLLGKSLVTLQYEDSQTHKVEYSSLLAEGQGDQTVSILEIDPVNALVRIQCGATESTLNFVRDGLKPSLAQATAPPLLPRPAPSFPVSPPAVEGASSSRVIIGNPPSLTPPASAPPRSSVLPPGMSREQAAEIIERKRKELLESGVAGQKVLGLMPPTRPDNGGNRLP